MINFFSQDFPRPPALPPLPPPAAALHDATAAAAAVRPALPAAPAAPAAPSGRVGRVHLVGRGRGGAVAGGRRVQEGVGGDTADTPGAAATAAATTAAAAGQEVFRADKNVQEEGVEVIETEYTGTLVKKSIF